MKRTLIKVALALVLMAVPAIAAFALSVDQTRTLEMRYFGYQMTHYYRITINSTDSGRGTGQKFGVLGRDTFITDIACFVTTAFDGTPTLTLGFDVAAANQIMATGGGATASVDLTSATYQHPTAANGLGQKFTSAGDITLYSKYSATAPTAGKGSCVIQFAPNNDM